MHEKNILHNDIHGSNFLVDTLNDKIKAKVVDFGLSTVLHKGETVVVKKESEVKSMERVNVGAPKVLNGKLEDKSVPFHYKAYDIHAFGSAFSNSDIDHLIPSLRIRMQSEDPENRPTIEEVIETFKQVQAATTETDPTKVMALAQDKEIDSDVLLNISWRSQKPMMKDAAATAKALLTERMQAKPNDGSNPLTITDASGYA